MADLRVELYGEVVGRLIGQDWRTFDFEADRSAIRRFSLGSTIVSESVPLEAVRTRSRAARRRNFFAELLPEGDSLAFLAQRRRLETVDTIGILRSYGRDVAGALQIYDPEVPGEPRTPAAEPLDDSGVRALLGDLQGQPLANRPLTGKSSLAGVQPKAVLALIDGRWHQAVDGYPSTHIVKPARAAHPTTIYDEELGSRYVRALGLAEFSTALVDFAGETALVVERYDRSPDSPTGRVHQEDMNQALGARGNEKYQSIGGKVSLGRMAAVFTARGDTPSATRLLRATVLAVAIGNLDMHAKNVSILHPVDGEPVLAPVYDVVPQAHEPNDGEMALAVNGVYAHREITRSDLVAEGESWGLRGAGTVVDEALEVVAALTARTSPHPRAHPTVMDDIASFTSRLRTGRATGTGRG